MYQSQFISQINTARPVNTAYSGSLFRTSCFKGWCLPLAAIEQFIMSSHAQQKKNAKATYYYFNMHHVLFFSGKTFQNVTFNKVMADCNTSVEFEVIVYRN